jgi:hypothetical protein
LRRGAYSRFTPIAIALAVVADFGGQLVAVIVSKRGNDAIRIGATGDISGIVIVILVMRLKGGIALSMIDVGDAVGRIVTETADTAMSFPPSSVPEYPHMFHSIDRLWDILARR